MQLIVSMLAYKCTCPLCLEKVAFSYSWDLVTVWAGGGGGKDEKAELVLDTSVHGGE